ncbi:hypothetical protein D3C84_474510 [compost metagenome]
MQHAQFFAAHLRHGGQPVTRLDRGACVVDDQQFVVSIGRVLQHTFDTTLKPTELILGHYHNGHQRLNAMLVVNSIDERHAAWPHLVCRTDTIKVRRQYAGVLLDNLRQSEPLRQAERGLDQHLGDMFHDMRAVVFDEAPDQVMRAELSEIRGETTRGYKALTLDGQCPPDIGITAQQVQIEIGLEDRLDRHVIAQAAFIGIDTQRVGTLDHPLGQKQQGQFIQAITGPQQIEPVRTVGLHQAIELLKPVALQGHTNNVARKGTGAIFTREHQHPFGAIDLPFDALQCDAQCRIVSVGIHHHRHNSRLPCPRGKARRQQALLGRVQGATRQPLQVHISKAVTVFTHPRTEQRRGKAQGTTQRHFFPVIRLTKGGAGQIDKANMPRRRCRLAAAHRQHLGQPTELDRHGLLDLQLIAQARRVQAFKAEHLCDNRQIATTQQADKQGEIETGDKPFADLGQRGQILQHLMSAHQRATQIAEKVQGRAFQHIQQVFTLEQRISRGKAGVLQTLGKQKVIAVAILTLSNHQIHVVMINKALHLTGNALRQQLIVITEKLEVLPGCLLGAGHQIPLEPQALFIAHITQCHGWRHCAGLDQLMDFIAVAVVTHDHFKRRIGLVQRTLQRCLKVQRVVGGNGDADKRSWFHGRGTRERWALTLERVEQP